MTVNFGYLSQKLLFCSSNVKNMYMKLMIVKFNLWCFKFELQKQYVNVKYMNLKLVW